MSATAVLTRAAPSTTTQPLGCCPSCGGSVTTSKADESSGPSGHESQDSAAAPSPPDVLLLQAQSRIAQLEAQVRQLNDKAAAAAARWAEYEAELHMLRSSTRTTTTTTQQRPSTPLQQQQQQVDPVQRSPPSILQQGTSRLSSLLYPRKSVSHPGRADPPRQNSLSLPYQSRPRPPSSPGAASAEDLMEALTREQTLRREAEGRLSATSKEVEELSVSLFEQANEMVASERRVRARLEERVGELERRDQEKRRRLDRLEGAVGRIEKARNLLQG